MKFINYILFTLFVQISYSQTEIIPSGLLGIAKENISVFEFPSLNSVIVGERKTQEFIYIFNQENNNNSNRSFYEIGYEADNIKGWVEKDKIKIWYNRNCLKFLPSIGRKPSIIWNTKFAIEDEIRGHTKSFDKNDIPNKNGIAIVPNISDKDWSMLAPILESKSFVSKGEIFYGYKIGFETKDNNLQPKPNKTKSPSKAGLEIVFLIESSADTHLYYDNIKDLIYNLSENLFEMADENIEVRVSFANHFDYLENNNFESTTLNITPFTNDLKHLESGLKESTSSHQSGSNSMYDSTVDVVSSADWDTNKPSLRLICWFGSKTIINENSPKNYYKFSTDKILSKIIDHFSHNRVRLFAFQVIDSTDSHHIFSSNLERLTEGKVASDKGLYAIIESNKLKQESFEDFFNTEIDRARTLFTLTNRPDFKTIFNTTTFQLKELNPNNQDRYLEGWVSEFSIDGNKQVEQFVMITKKEFDLFLFYLNASKIVTDNTENKIIENMVRILEAQSGEKIKPNESIKTFLEKKLNLPIESNLLNFELDAIESMSDLKLNRINQQIENKIELLNSFGDSTVWHTIRGTGSQYTFIPIELFP